MKASEAVRKLELIIKTCGDLPIVGGYVHADMPLRNIIMLDAQDVRTFDPKKAVSIFLE